jgi:hypothetical protein
MTIRMKTDITMMAKSTRIDAMVNVTGFSIKTKAGDANVVRSMYFTLPTRTSGFMLLFCNNR